MFDRKKPQVSRAVQINIGEGARLKSFLRMGKGRKEPGRVVLDVSDSGSMRHG